MKQYPLLFDRVDVVIGNGFVAGVVMKGRTLFSEEADDEFWMYGVNPGGVAEYGKTRPEVLAAFSRAYVEVLHDIAFEAGDFSSFEEHVTSFFLEDNRREEWKAAVAEVRATQETVDWVPTASANTRRGVKIHDLSSAGLNPKANLEPVEDSYRQAA